MDAKTHWEKVYQTMAPDAVSWYSPHLATSLALIERVASARSASIMDVGGGESTLVDDLLVRGYQRVTVLDVSPTAVELATKRLGSAAAQVRWIVADITEIKLEPHTFDLWHDRAVFHFLTTDEERVAYVRQVSTFGPEGPRKCSGLAVMRYGSRALHREFGARFRLMESSTELHHTPFGTTQQFLYCYCQID